MEIPKLISSKQVADMLGIDPRNMKNHRKGKKFPHPVQTVDKFPVWLESDVLAYKEAKEAKKDAQNSK